MTTKDQLVSFQHDERLMKGVGITKNKFNLIQFFQNVDVNFVIDIPQIGREILTDLFKAFDCTSYDLLTNCKICCVWL